MSLVERVAKAGEKARSRVHVKHLEWGRANKKHELVVIEGTSRRKWTDQREFQEEGTKRQEDAEAARYTDVGSMRQTAYGREEYGEEGIERKVSYLDEMSEMRTWGVKHRETKSIGRGRERARCEGPDGKRGRGIWCCV
jgi:hypothetical protein